MEPIGTALLNLGIGGTMAAAVVGFGWHLTSKVLPQLLEQAEKNSAWQQEQMRAQRSEFIAALDRQQAASLAAMERQEGRLLNAVDRLCGEIHELKTALERSHGLPPRVAAAAHQPQPYRPQPPHPRAELRERGGADE